MELTTTDIFYWRTFLCSQKFRPDQAIQDGLRQPLVIWKWAPFDGGPLFAAS